MHRQWQYWRLSAVLALLLLSGCTPTRLLLHAYSDHAPPAHTHRYADGGSSLYYAFTINATDSSANPDTFIFFYGGSGCPSWKYVMPDYPAGLTIPARVFALNKRHVEDRSTGMFGCSEAFHRVNNPAQWQADYTEFIRAQLAAATPKPRNVVLVGVSEGSIQAVRVAATLPEITHLAIIGDGAYGMRKSLTVLRDKGAIAFDVEAGWRAIASDPQSLDKTWFGHPYRWWSDVMDLDLLPDFLALNIPVLVGMGEQDESVPIESVQYLESKFKQAGKSNLTLKIYPGANHGLKAGNTSHRPAFFAELGRLITKNSQP